jgi:hypothetical protein
MEIYEFLSGTKIRRGKPSIHKVESYASACIQ